MYPEPYTLLDLAEQRRQDLLKDAVTWRQGFRVRRRGQHRRHAQVFRSGAGH